jgi:endonuclease YncB( thermonuclease family)
MTASSRSISNLRLTPLIGWRVGVLAAALAALCVVVCTDAVAQEPVAPAAVCGSAIITHGTAKQIIDGRTFLLDDGREVRLAAIEVPPIEAPPQQADAAAAAARNALAAQLANADVVVRQADIAVDRHGRSVGYAYVRREGAERLAQTQLLAAGFARVAARVGGRDCAAELLRAESAAQQAKLGLWANSYYDVLDAEKPADLMAQLGHFALVEGKVVSVRESGATIYVNFGRRWTEDFTVTILKRNERRFATAGVEPKRLAGERVLVRGFIEERGGPWIEAAQPEQIELAGRN